jgi:hypothetical protein
MHPPSLVRWLDITIAAVNLYEGYKDVKISVPRTFWLISHWESSLMKSAIAENNFIRFNKLIRALSAAALAAKFNISPGRWHHFWPVAIVPTER